MRLVQRIIAFFISLILFIVFLVVATIAFVIKNVLLNPRVLLLLSAFIVLFAVVLFIAERVSAKH